MQWLEEIRKTHRVETVGRCVLINADCMDVMAKMPDGAFDLAVVDVPYGIGVNVSMGRRKGNKKSSYHKFAGEDKSAPDSGYFDKLKAISGNQIIWGANHFIDSIPFMCNSPCWLMWDKGFSEDVTFAQFELAWTSFNTTCKKFDKSPQNQHRIHPTEKPQRLYQWILDNYAKQGDSILDTHLGSGSSAIACNRLGFDFVGIELDADYFEAALKRIKQEYKQQDMFAPQSEQIKAEQGSLL